MDEKLGFDLMMPLSTVQEIREFSEAFKTPQHLTAIFAAFVIVQSYAQMKPQHIEILKKQLAEACEKLDKAERKRVKKKLELVKDETEKN